MTVPSLRTLVIEEALERIADELDIDLDVHQRIGVERALEEMLEREKSASRQRRNLWD